VNLRVIAHRLLPPIIADALRKLLGRRNTGASRFEVVGPVWPAAPDSNPGWEDTAIAASQADRWQAWCDACAGTAPLDVAHEAAEPTPRNLPFHNNYMTFGYILALTAAKRGDISVLDWGGGLGHYAVLAHSLLPDARIEYHCKDLAHFCREGSTLSPQVIFHEDASCLERTYDLVVASGSLQCSSDWKAVIAGLAKATRSYLYVSRLPVLLDSPSVVVRQHAGAMGFNDELLGWFLNKDELLAEVAIHDMELVREFYIDEPPLLEGPFGAVDVRGFLFRPLKK